jgi:uncharacterized protein YjbI with pentapeptide repeats
MPPRRPATKVTTPLSPERPSEPIEAEHSGVSSDEEWEDERVFDADLTGQVADRVRLTRCELHRVALTGAQLRGLTLVDVLAVDCELSGAFLHEAKFQRVELRNCRMTGVVMSQSNLKHLRLVECKLDGANLRLTRADHVQMSDCTLVDADFYEAVLTNSVLDGCDLRGSAFSKAAVRGLRLGGSKLDGVRGATSMGGVVVAGDQVLPLALSLFGDLGIDIENDDSPTR